MFWEPSPVEDSFFGGASLRYVFLFRALSFPIEISIWGEVKIGC